MAVEALLHGLVTGQAEQAGPRGGIAKGSKDAFAVAEQIGFPVVVRPSYVLGGRAMEIVHSDEDLEAYMDAAIGVSNNSPVLLDRFLDLATEVDVDCICDGERVLIGGVMEHIEQAGVHSGDSACSLPPHSLKPEIVRELERQAAALARAQEPGPRRHGLGGPSPEAIERWRSLSPEERAAIPAIPPGRWVGVDPVYDRQ